MFPVDIWHAHRLIAEVLDRCIHFPPFAVLFRAAVDVVLFRLSVVRQVFRFSHSNLLRN